MNSTKFKSLSAKELNTIIGGGPIADLGTFVNKAWSVLYNTGKDFGRNLAKAIL